MPVDGNLQEGKVFRGELFGLKCPGEMSGSKLSGRGNLWGNYPGGMAGGMSGSPCRIESVHAAVMICATVVNTHRHTDSFD